MHCSTIKWRTDGNNSSHLFKTEQWNRMAECWALCKAQHNSVTVLQSTQWYLVTTKTRFNTRLQRLFTLFDTERLSQSRGELVISGSGLTFLHRWHRCRVVLLVHETLHAEIETETFQKYAETRPKRDRRRYVSRPRRRDRDPCKLLLHTLLLL